MKALVETGLLVGGPAKGAIKPFTGDNLLQVVSANPGPATKLEQDPPIKTATYRRALIRGETADFGFWLWTKITIDEGMAELFGAAAAGWGSAGWGGKR